MHYPDANIMFTMNALRVSLLGLCAFVVCACSDSQPNAQAHAQPTAALAKIEQSKDPSANGGSSKPQVDPPARSEAPASGEEASPVAQCARICAKSSELRCARAAQCEAICEQSMVLPACQGEMIAANECMLAQPTSRWECTPDGLAALKDGCEAEQDRFVACLSRL